VPDSKKHKIVYAPHQNKSKKTGLALQVFSLYFLVRISGRVSVPRIFFEI
jgi:hypothetical protein